MVQGNKSRLLQAHHPSHLDIKMTQRIVKAKSHVTLKDSIIRTLKNSGIFVQLIKCSKLYESYIH